MTQRVDFAEKARAYAQAHAALTLGTIDGLVELCSENVVFRDPFNDTVGRTALQHVLADMFAHTTAPQTHVLDIAGSGQRWFIKWRFSAGLPVVGQLDTLGLTEIELDPDGLVMAHVDYWDSGPAIYGRLPVIGRVVRHVRRRLSAASRQDSRL